MAEDRRPRRSQAFPSFWVPPPVGEQLPPVSGLTFHPAGPDSFWKPVGQLVLPVLVALFAGAHEIPPLAPVSLVYLPTPQAPGPIRAFYGAVGFGADAWSGASGTDCRGKPIQVLKVTNTNNSGTGSLVQAVSDANDGNATFIIFTVGGLIPTITNNEKKLDGTKDCVQIPGQTARGAFGVYLADTIVPGADVLRLTDGGGPLTDVIIRYIRAAPDTLVQGDNSECCNPLTVTNVKYAVFDHMSLRHGGDQILSLTTSAGGDRRLDHISVTNSILAAAFKEGPFSSSRNADTVNNVTWARNLVAFYVNRGPEISRQDTGSFANLDRRRWEAINNYNYAHASRFGNIRGGIDSDFVGNRFECAEDTCSCSATSSTNTYRWNASWKDDGTAGPTRGKTSIHVSDSGQDDSGCDFLNYQLFREVASGGSFKGALPDSIKRDTVFQPQPRFLVTPFSRAAVLDTLIGPAGLQSGVVGANALIDCDGSWLTSRRDTLDRYVIGQVRARGPLPASPRGSGSYVVWAAQLADYTTGTPCTDTDGDGLPDAFESRCGPDNTSLAPDAVRTGGYWAIEVWAHGGIEEPDSISWTDIAGESEYRIKRWRDGVGWIQIATVGANVTGYKELDQQWLPKDSLRVVAWNSSGGEGELGPAVAVVCP